LKLFALSLEEDASDWFSGLDDNKFKTISELIEAFTERWGDKKEHRHLLASLHTIKKNENETMEEFNKKFNDLISSLHKDIKPLDASISSSIILKPSMVK
jgi:predicted transcriptional regulator